MSYCLMTRHGTGVDYQCTPGDRRLEEVAELQQFLHVILAEQPLLGRQQQLETPLRDRLGVLGKQDTESGGVMLVTPVANLYD